MPDISITVTDKRPVCIAGTTIVCDNSDYIVHWDLDAEWSAYDSKTMRVIYMDSTYADIVFSGDSVALPPVPVPGCVQIGLYAGDIHTSRMALLRALSSVRSASGAPANPTPDVYDQLMELIKGLGGVDPDDIAKAVADYLAAHPIEETDPTVPEWAKAKTKPTYSAAEVGSISQSDLQAATDAALAQAKASGEFDGPRGPAGAPGKDGAGMDITGASVGQIAKIAAVDESGKPTKWGPVDIPSGGSETWELIRDFTLTDDVVQVTINLDENGKPFRLKKAYVFITATAPTDESITYAADICCSPAKESPSVWGTNTVFVGQSPAFGQSTRYTMSLWDTYGNFLLPVEIKSSDGNSTADRLVTKTRYYDAGAIVATDSGLGFLQSPCESFAFGSYRKTLFTGANIKIYGVRV